MHRISILIAALALPAVASLPNHSSAQALSNKSATIYITSGTSVYVVGDLSNSTAGSTISNSGTLYVSGNTSNNGTISTSAGSVLNLNGTSAQTLSGATINATDVVVNNSAGITLSTPLQVDGAMTFTSGLVSATNASYPVIFTANGSVSGTPTDASHVDGYVQKLGTGAFTYPVGNATKYQPVGVNLAANSAGMTARYFSADPGAATYGTGGTSSTPLLSINRKEYWDLTPTGTATGAVTIYFDGYNNGGINSTADLRVAHKSGGQYLNEGAVSVSGTTTSGFVTSNSISSFSPFTLGSISNNSPLPVKLISFTAAASGARASLEWHTGVEDAGVLFIVERSTDGAAFQHIGAAAGKGSNSDYTFLDDEAPQRPVAYYRLAMATPAATTYSAIVAVRRATQGGSITVAPVPAQSRITITNTSDIFNGQPATIVDMQGRAVSAFTLQGTQEIDVRAWPSGVYTLRLPDGTALRIVRQ